MPASLHWRPAGSVALDPGLTTTDINTPAIQHASSNGGTIASAPFTFSAFDYTSTATGTGVAYSATGVLVTPFSSSVGGVTETGITFSGGFGVGTGGTQDEQIDYTVTAAPGTVITDAYLAITGSATGNAFATVGESLYNHATGLLIGTLSADTPGSTTDSISFAGVTSIDVVKDINLNGGTIDGSHVSVSVITQGFSTMVPEPASMALLGIGMAGFFTYRRLFKRAAV